MGVDIWGTVTLVSSESKWPVKLWRYGRSKYGGMEVWMAGNLRGCVVGVNVVGWALRRGLICGAVWARVSVGPETLVLAESGSVLRMYCWCIKF